MSEQIRLQAFLARAGVGSRRSCEKLITNREVKVNGRIVDTLGSKVELGDTVTWRGRVLHPVERMVYVALHKPVGYLCTARDDQGRPLAGDLLKGAVETRVYNVGRLDFMSSGLILYTNDGELTRLVTHPSTGVEKEYLVDTVDPLPLDRLEQYKRGIRVGRERYQLRDYQLLGPRRLRLTLIEGRNREIRRFMDHIGVKIRRLCRTRVGIVTLKGIPEGSFRFLRQREIDWFLSRRS